MKTSKVVRGVRKTFKLSLMEFSEVSGIGVMDCLKISFGRRVDLTEMQLQRLLVLHCLSKDFKVYSLKSCAGVKKLLLCEKIDEEKVLHTALGEWLENQNERNQ